MSLDSDFWSFRLPTLSSLNATAPTNVDTTSVASSWLTRFGKHVEIEDTQNILSLFIPSALWRDLLALTWDFRCFDGHRSIERFLSDCMPRSHMSNIISAQREPVMLQKPFPDLVWIVVPFSFQTVIGNAIGIARLVPTCEGDWKAAAMFTNLESLKSFPEQVGRYRQQSPTAGLSWKLERESAANFATSDPEVIVVGAGHAGLSLSARLKFLGVKCLAVDSQHRIGDSWRNRYDSLCLHWPIWYDHMPYMPFPETWPKYSPSYKLADWLEHYSKNLELNVWTSSTVASARLSTETRKWEVMVEKTDGSKRTLSVDHVVFATGFGDYEPYVPNVPGKHLFSGRILHSTQYKRASDFSGQKVIVVGSGNSGHDISADLANHNIDVTMFQRGPNFVMNLDKNWMKVAGQLYSESSAPTEVADRLFASMPHAYSEGGMMQRATQAIEATDKDLLDGLKSVGFKLCHGIKDTGIFLLLKQKGGGHYFDVGASQMIIDGRIKLKNDSGIRSYSETGFIFEDRSHLDADAIIFATGLGSLSSVIKSVCGDDIAKRCKPILGIDEEGELRGLYRDLGVHGLWYTTGNFQMSRFYSKHLALQIKAIQEGLLEERYSLDGNL